MDQTFWGVVSAAVGRLGLWVSNEWDTLFPRPGAGSSPLGATFESNKVTFVAEENVVWWHGMVI